MNKEKDYIELPALEELELSSYPSLEEIAEESLSVIEHKSLLLDKLCAKAEKKRAKKLAREKERKEKEEKALRLLEKKEKALLNKEKKKCPYLNRTPDDIAFAEKWAKNNRIPTRVLVKNGWVGGGGKALGVVLGKSLEVKREAPRPCRICGKSHC